MAENIDVNIAFTDKGLEEVIKNSDNLKKSITSAQDSTKNLNNELTKQVSDPYAKVAANLQLMRDKFQLVKSVVGQFSDEIDSIKIDKLTEGFSKFGLTSEQVVSIGGDLISFFSGTLTPIGLLTSVVSVLATTFKDDLIPIVNKVINEVNAVIDPIGTANDEFDKQLELVSNIDDEMPSLVKTYEELSKKQNLSADEQRQLNEATARIAELMPQAVIGVDSYTGALKINVDAIKAATAEEKNFLRLKAETVIALNQAESDRLEKLVKGAAAELQTNKALREDYISTFVSGRPQVKVIDVDKAERKEILKDLDENLTKRNELKVKIEQAKATLEALNGTQKIVNTTAKQGDESISKVAEKTKDAANEQDKLLSKLDSLLKKVKASSDDASIKLLENNEAVVRGQKAKSLELINSQENEVNELAKQLGKKVDVTKDFENQRLLVESEYIAKIRVARARDLKTAFDVDDLVKPLKDQLNKINLDDFKLPENKALATAILDPKEFERQFNEVNKNAKLGADELNKIIKSLVKNTGSDIDKITDPLEKFKKKILDALGLDPKQAGVVINQLSNFGNAYADFYTAKNEASEKAHQAEISRIDAELGKKKEALDTELQRQKEGSANSVQLVKDQIAELEKQKAETQKKANEDRQKNLKAQLVADEIQQASNLVVTISEIYKGFSSIPIVGLILGGLAVGGFLLSISAAKQKAKAAAKFEKGGEIFGNSHANGGVMLAPQIEAEGGEFVINKGVTQRHKPFIRALNDGKLDRFDLNYLVAASAVSDSAHRAEQAQRNADNYQRTVIHEAITSAIKQQTKELIAHDKSKETIVPTTEGYLSIKENQTGGKNMKFVKL